MEILGDAIVELTKMLIKEHQTVNKTTYYKISKEELIRFVIKILKKVEEYSKWIMTNMVKLLMEKVHIRK